MGTWERQSNEWFRTPIEKECDTVPYRDRGLAFMNNWIDCAASERESTRFQIGVGFKIKDEIAVHPVLELTLDEHAPIVFSLDEARDLLDKLRSFYDDNREHEFIGNEAHRADAEGMIEALEHGIKTATTLGDTSMRPN